MLSKEKIIMVKKTTCQVKLQNHKWMISFTYHGKEECFYPVLRRKPRPT